MQDFKQDILSVVILQKESGKLQIHPRNGGIIRTPHLHAKFALIRDAEMFKKENLTFPETGWQR